MLILFNEMFLKLPVFYETFEAQIMIFLRNLRLKPLQCFLYKIRSVSSTRITFVAVTWTLGCRIESLNQDPSSSKGCSDESAQEIPFIGTTLKCCKYCKKLYVLLLSSPFCAMSMRNQWRNKSKRY